MSGKKLESILNLIEIAEGNLRAAKTMLQQMGGLEKLPRTMSTTPISKSSDEDRALEVVEGYFDGESMIGDNGQVYIVPPNYASKTQLVVGDRMKWILTQEREVFKLIQPAPRERITGTFAIEGDNFVVLSDRFASPIKILKASATFAIKNLGLQPGDEVAIYIPKDTTPTWGAFNSVVKSTVGGGETGQPAPAVAPDEVDNFTEFKMDDLKIGNEHDYF
jgi:hypothetical protein